MAIKVNINSTANRRTATVSSIKTNSKVQTAQSLDGLNGVSLEDLENGDTLVYNKSTDTWEAAPLSDANLSVQNIDGGTF